MIRPYLEISEIFLIGEEELSRKYTQLVFKLFFASIPFHEFERPDHVIDYLKNESGINKRLIIYDLHFPVKNIFEFVTQYEDLNRNDILIILCSSDYLDEIQKLKEFSCIRHIISKPLFASRIEMIINGRE